MLHTFMAVTPGVGGSLSSPEELRSLLINLNQSSWSRCMNNQAEGHRGFEALITCVENLRNDLGRVSV